MKTVEMVASEIQHMAGRREDSELTDWQVRCCVAVEAAIDPALGGMPHEMLSLIMSGMCLSLMWMLENEMIS